MYVDCLTDTRRIICSLLNTLRLVIQHTQAVVLAIGETGPYNKLAFTLQKNKFELLYRKLYIQIISCICAIAIVLQTCYSCTRSISHLCVTPYIYCTHAHTTKGSRSDACVTKNMCLCGHPHWLGEHQLATGHLASNMGRQSQYGEKTWRRSLDLLREYMKQVYDII